MIRTGWSEHTGDHFLYRYSLFPGLRRAISFGLNVVSRAGGVTNVILPVAGRCRNPAAWLSWPA